MTRWQVLTESTGDDEEAGLKVIEKTKATLSWRNWPDAIAV